MDVVVTRTPDGWVARHGEMAAGTAAALVRPDGRCFVAFRACHADAYRRWCRPSPGSCGGTSTPSSTRPTASCSNG